MSEFPELDKLAGEVEAGKPSGIPVLALLLGVVGIFIFAALLLAMVAFFSTWSLI